ncbi:MAG: PIN domain-containing protein [Rhodothermaceae bacterium]|nr:PIN domain-containing protein [Rhodothermaceae bacterium]MYC03080.1 PIN domain-containing protein [Rhodothermaceae bacterium]MYI16545.1 PIN domain-containing protein [Rhodothermaceae bacterium]
MRKSKPTLRYWDSCVFLAYLKEEPERVVQCDAILKAAQESKTLIITSSVTLFEVLWLDKDQRYDENSKQKIRDLFEYSFIKIADLTRFVADQARELKWEYHDIQIKDAGHLATVIESDVSRFETYDRKLIEYDKKFKNKLGQEIRIVEPFITTEPGLPF